MGLVDFVSAYTAKYVWGIGHMDMFAMKRAIDAIEKANCVYVGGNGGSAAISNHLCCDFNKGAAIRAISLSSNLPLITAIANDIEYEDTLAYQIERYSASEEDIILLISSSGNSPNIIKGALAAKRLGRKVIGLTGFNGGKLRELCDINVHIAVDNYGVVEDCHQGIMHIISQYIQQKGSDKCLPLISPQNTKT